MAWLIALIFVALPSYLIRFSVLGIPTTVLEVLIYSAFLWLLIAQPIALTLERIRPALKYFAWPTLFLLVGAIIGLSVAPDLRVALGLVKGYLLDPILLTLLLIASRGTNEGWDPFHRIIRPLLLSGVWVGLSAFLLNRASDGRYLGIYGLDQFASPNFLALYLAPIAILGLGTLIWCKFDRMYGGLGFAAGLLGVILSGSRGALLALLFGICLTLFLWLLYHPTYKKWRKLWIAGFAGICLVGLVAGSQIARPNFGDQATVRASTSNNIRYEIWRTTIVDIIPKKWLTGVGIGNFQLYFTEITANRVNFPEFISPWALSPHNIFLTIWVNLGIFGIVGFVWLLIAFFRMLTPILHKPMVAPIYFASMVTLLVHGLVDAAYWKNDLAILFWTLLVLAYFILSSSKEYQAKKETR